LREVPPTVEIFTFQDRNRRGSLKGEKFEILFYSSYRTLGIERLGILAGCVHGNNECGKVCDFVNWSLNL